MSRVLVTRVDSEGSVSSLVLAGHTVGLQQLRPVATGNVRLFLDACTRAVNYNRESDLGVRVEYFLNGNWGEYYATGVFSRASAEAAQDVVDAIRDCDRPIEEFARQREVEATSLFLNPSMQDYRRYLAHFLDTCPDQVPMSYRDWLSSDSNQAIYGFATKSTTESTDTGQ